MAFTGYAIFPGLRTIGIVADSVRELAVTFNMDAIEALQKPPEEDLLWADNIAGVTAAPFEAKIPLDLTALDGFEPFKGTRTYKQIDITAIEAHVQQWQRNLEWDIRFTQAGPVLQQVYNTAKYADAMVYQARVMKARLAASVLMLGTPSTNLVQVYAGNNIPGAGKSLFSLTHYSNPLDGGSRPFANYFPASGLFNGTSYATTRANMRQIPSPTQSAETLGLQVTDIIGPSIMEEPFRQLALSQLILQTGSGGATGAVGAVSNIYAAGITPCNFWIAPQLDGDPYLQANPGKHLWFAVSRKLIGAHPIEMVAPTKEFTPIIQIFGDGSELAAQTRKVHLMGDLDAGAAAGLPHTIARYEQT